MSNYDEPTWVNPATNDAPATTEEADTGGHVTAPPTPIEDYKRESKKSLPLMVMSILNIGSAAMMAALGVLTLVEVNKSGSVNNLSEPFLASYMCMFALLLGLYELMWWMPTPNINRVIRKNFGFLYGLLGKGFYLIFVACLCVGLGTDARIKVLNYSTGGCWIAMGLVHVFIVCFRPELAVQYHAPTAGLSSPSDQLTNVV
ncbi:unnamed protein product [Cylindrotheca closterium]|uniref:Uncharacterized protein n=1 Tax=Cylindrotheca closterium TaxID=2856 RepID=A0AAD2CM55_9STRA|nr:unnamed protein product [Cylindrotheca closterium]